MGIDDESKAEVASKIDSLRQKVEDGELGDDLLNGVAGGHTNGTVHTNGSPGGIHTNGTIHTNSGVQEVAAPAT